MVQVLELLLGSVLVTCTTHAAFGLKWPCLSGSNRLGSLQLGAVNAELQLLQGARVCICSPCLMHWKGLLK